MTDLISYYREKLNLYDATFSLIEHDDGVVAIVYKVSLPTIELILKICARPEEYLREVYFLNYFADKLPVPRIVNLVPPEGTAKGAVLMECLPGSILKMADLTESLANEMGTLLARIHTYRVAGYGDLTRPDALSNDPQTVFTMKFEEGLKECGRHLPKELIEQCQLYFDQHAYLLDSVDGPCILHRDFRPGNVIVDKGKLQGIIDWASSRAGFAEEDFCPMEHDGWPNDPKIKQAFLDGYSSIRPLPGYEAMMPLLRVSRAVASIGFVFKTGTWQTRTAAFYQFNRRFLETFLRDFLCRY